MGRGKQLARKAGRLPERGRFLIYTEGNVTEVTYIKGLRAELGRSGPNIVLGGAHNDPITLVRDAIRHRQREESQGDGFDEVWCVFDVECPVAHASLSEAISLARTNRISCAISNPCFELWLILHFCDHRSWLTTADACNLLTELGCKYSATSKSFDYEACRESYEEALGRAQELARTYDSATGVQDRNPWLSVHELFERLRRASD